MSKSNYLELAMVDLVLGAAAFSAPATVYVSLHTADPTDAGTGTEASGGSYARKSVTNNSTNFPSGNPKSNGTAITFATPSAGWGTVTHFGIWDASSGGNLLYYGALGTSKTINSGDTVSFAIGALVVTED